MWSERPFLATAIVVALTAAVSRPTQDPAEIEQRIREIAATEIGGEVAGLSIAVLLGGDVLVADGWGYIAPGTTADEDAAYRAGALLPAFLSVAALRLVERDELDLDDPVSQHLDGLFADEGVTVEHLLTHTSGVPAYTDLYAASDEVVLAPDAEVVLAWLREAPLDSSPGECLLYSNTNHLLLGLIVEKVAEASVAEVLEREVLRVASMDDTEFCVEGPALREYAWIAQEFAGSIEDQEDAPQPFGAPALCSTAADLARWQRALVERTLLTDAGYDLLTTPVRLRSDEETSYGRGLSLTALDDFACHSAGGSMAGDTVHVAYFPDADLTIAVLACGEEAPARRVARRIARTVFDLPEPGLQDLPLGAEERARYLGEYFVGCNAYLVSQDERHLVVRPPVGPSWVLLFQGHERFVSASDSDVFLTFDVTDDEVVGFVLEEHGVTSRAKRLR